MRASLVIGGVLLALFSASCGPPPAGGGCGVMTVLDPAVRYVATIPSLDGGMPTQVELTVVKPANFSEPGLVDLKFVNSRQVVERWSTTRR